MQTALITGACGFTGHHLAKRLRELGEFRTVGVDLAPSAPTDLEVDDYLGTDLTDSRSTRHLMERCQPQVVFHLAGLLRGVDSAIWAANLLSTIALLESLVSITPRAKIVLVGSAAEYGPVADRDLPVREIQPCHPRGAYALSKYAATLAGLDYYQRTGLQVVVARPFNLIGAGVPDSVVVGAVLERYRLAALVSGQPVVHVGNIESVRDFLAIEDAVEGYIRLVQGEHWGEVFNLCSGQPRSVRSVVEGVLSYAPLPVRLEVDPKLLRRDDVPLFYGSCEKARAAFGFEARIGLQDCMREAFHHAVRREV